MRPAKSKKLGIINLFIITMLLGYMNISLAADDKFIHAGQFSTANITDVTPLDWTPLTFDSIEKHTAYFLTRDKSTTVMKAVSNASASGYFKELNVDPKQYPILQWSWKIENLIKAADINSKKGDDYPARLYITFEYDIERLPAWDRFKVKVYQSSTGKLPPLAVLNYVWDNKQAVGYLTPNAYTDRVRMIVAETGHVRVGQWVQEQTNIYKDYIKAFGEEPGNITGIAIMTDTDNTKESATAYYGDIRLKRLSLTEK